jgi:hypothetical protein
MSLTGMLMGKFDFAEPPTTNTAVVTDIALRLLDAIDNGDVSEVLAVKREYQAKDLTDAFNLLNDEQQSTLKVMGRVTIETYTLED